MSKKVLYYLNQFFSQIGGEDKAGIAPHLKKNLLVQLLLLQRVLKIMESLPEP